MSDLSDAVFKGHLAGEAIANDGNISNAVPKASIEAKIAEGFSSLADDMTDAESAILEAKIASGVAENGDNYNDLAGDIIESQIEGEIAEGFL